MCVRVCVCVCACVCARTRVWPSGDRVRTHSKPACGACVLHAKADMWPAAQAYLRPFGLSGAARTVSPTAAWHRSSTRGAMERNTQPLGAPPCPRTPHQVRRPGTICALGAAGRQAVSCHQRLAIDVLAADAPSCCPAAPRHNRAFDVHNERPLARRRAEPRIACASPDAPLPHPTPHARAAQPLCPSPVRIAT